MVLGSVWFILFWGAVIYLVFFAASRSSPSESGHEPPLDILKRRYANGEITKEEFDRMRQELS